MSGGDLFLPTGAGRLIRVLTLPPRLLLRADRHLSQIANGAMLSWLFLYISRAGRHAGDRHVWAESIWAVYCRALLSGGDGRANPVPSWDV